MFRFLAGCATGWMMARAPPTQAELTKAVDRIVVMFALEKYLPQETEKSEKSEKSEEPG